MKLTYSQRSYLEVANLAPLAREGLQKGASLKCVRALVRLGLLRSDPTYSTFEITDAGRAALAEPKP